MMQERRVLLIILSITLFLSLFGSLLYVGLDKLSTIQNQIELIKKQYVKHQAAPVEQMDLNERMQELKRAEDAELHRYYQKEDMDLYRFGGGVNALLARHSITVEEFRTVSEASGSFIELTTRGSAPSFMAFLSAVSSGEKYWTIPYLHIQSSSGDGSLTCEFQIGYLFNETAKQTP